jgi:hypothetical protein
MGDACDLGDRVVAGLAAGKRDHRQQDLAVVGIEAEGAADEPGALARHPALEALVGLGVLSPTCAARRDRVFVARAILDILEEPARLVADKANGPRRRGVITRRERR